VAPLDSGTTYYYRVRAYNAALSPGNYSSTITVITAPVPLAATAIGTTTFTANWKASPGSVRFRLDVDDNADFSSLIHSDVDVGNGTSFVVNTGLAANTPYYYRLRVENADGTSANSAAITVTTAPPTPTSDPATNTDNDSFTANWQAATGATAYLLDISTSNTFSSFVSGYDGRNVGNALTFTTSTVAPLDSGTTYYYRVRATNAGGGFSANSLMQTVITAPVALAASNETANTSFQANWKASPGSVAFFIDVNDASDFTGTAVHTNQAAGTGTNFVVAVTSGTYYYRIRVQNADGTSANSNTITVVVP
jgi:hypothetical protein